MKQTEQPRNRRVLREIAIFGLIMLGIFAARSTLADHYRVPSGSMEHTLYPGDRVFVDKRAYGLRLPFTNIDMVSGDAVNRGDVAIFDSPADGVRLIKRVVAIGGDTVEIENGHLSINGRAIRDASNAAVEVFDGEPVHLNLANGGGPDFSQRVPEGMLLTIGDHRGNSKDGRFFGFVKERNVYGKAVGVYYRRGEGLTWRPL